MKSLFVQSTTVSSFLSGPLPGSLWESQVQQGPVIVSSVFVAYNYVKVCSSKYYTWVHIAFYTTLLTEDKHIKDSFVHKQNSKI